MKLKKVRIQVESLDETTERWSSALKGKVKSNLGFVELREEGTKKTLVPIAKFDGIEFGLAA